MDILSLLFSKLGAIGAGILGVLALWFYGKHQKAKRAEAESRAEVAEKVLEVEHEQEKREKVVDGMSDGDVVDYWGGVRNQTGDSAPSPTGKATTRKPD